MMRGNTTTVIGRRRGVDVPAGAGKMLRDGEDAYGLFAAQLSARDDEALRVAHLDADGRMIGLSQCEDADRRAVDLPIRAILRDAVVWGSASLLIAHNHPSGDPTPSSADIDATYRLVEAARVLGVRVVDHLVFAGDGCSSFRALGLL